MQNSAIAQELQAMGFVETDTGGGCVAWVKEWPNGAQVLVTDSANEGYLPELEDAAVDVGFYDREGVQTGWAPFPTLRYAVDNMSALVAFNMSLNVVL